MSDYTVNDTCIGCGTPTPMALCDECVERVKARQEARARERERLRRHLWQAAEDEDKVASPAPDAAAHSSD